MDCNRTFCKEILLTMYPSRRRELLRNKVDTIAFRFCGTIIRNARGYIKIGQVTLSKEMNANSLIKRPNLSCHKQPTFSCLTTFSMFLNIFTLFIHSSLS